MILFSTDTSFIQGVRKIKPNKIVRNKKNPFSSQPQISVPKSVRKFLILGKAFKFCLPFFPTFGFFFRSVFGFFFRTPFYSVPANSTTSLQNKVSVTRTSKSEDPWFSSDSSFTTSMAPHGYEFNLSIWRNWGWLVDGEEGWMEGEVGQNVLANRCGIPVDKWVDSRSFGKTFWLKCALGPWGGPIYTIG